MAPSNENPLIAPDVAERVLARTLVRGGDFAEVYAERRHGLSVQFDDGRLEGASDGSEEGVGLRLVVGDATYFGHVDSLEEEQLAGLADSLAQAAGSTAVNPVTLARASVTGFTAVDPAACASESARPANCSSSSEST